MRQRQENVILVGVIPGPSEPKHDFNNYFDPYVQDLKKWLKGMSLSVKD